MDTLILFLQLFKEFFVIGAFTIGGGYAMLSLIQGQVVTAHHWITESTFTDIVAISQMTPGPIGINTATYVGYDVVSQATGSHLLGICGSATATLALVLPSFVLVLLIVRFYTQFKNSATFQGTPSFAVVRDNFPDWKSWCLLAAAFVASYWGKINPILVILGAAVLGLLIY